MNIPSNIDLRVVQKLSFECVKGCGLCCAFRPQIADFELAAYKNDADVSPNITEEINDLFETEYFLRLQSDKENTGACMFIDGEKLCTIYAKRPFKCRLFPFYIRFGDGIQVDADLACTGFWTNNKNNTEQLVKKSLKELCAWDESTGAFLKGNNFSDRFEKMYTTANSNYIQICDQLKKEGLFVEKNSCRDGAQKILKNMSDINELDTILVNIGKNSNIEKPEQLISKEYEEYGIVEEMSRYLVSSAFSGKSRPVDFPLYLDDQNSWQFLTLDMQKKEFVLKVFDRTGTISELSRKPFIKPPLSPLTSEAKLLFLWYIDILNMRQSSYDFALLTTAESKSGTLFGSYVYMLSLFAVEAWSWAQIYSYIKGTPLDAYALQKGIQAIDNSRVTGPSFDVI